MLSTTYAALAKPDTDPAKTVADLPHVMSATAVAVLLLLALVIDYMSVGPNSLRDRLAFLMGVAAIREGFNGSPLDRWTVGMATRGIEMLLSSPPVSGSYLAGASINAVVGAAVGLLFLYTVGCLLPMKASKKLGRFATLNFPQSPMMRINWKLWAAAILLGMLADLPAGFIGGLTEGSVVFLTGLFAPLPEWLFGA
ncbi:hypothetical protein [Actinoplanes sp. NPDC049118]|uniref:hypothetical protein n=1 Tax=Actinoplanes sp. NPDC049118 TaxID=3155769 RepID=UPI0033CC04B4